MAEETRRIGETEMNPSGIRLLRRLSKWKIQLKSTDEPRVVDFLDACCEKNPNDICGPTCDALHNEVFEYVPIQRIERTNPTRVYRNTESGIPQASLPTTIRRMFYSIGGNCVYPDFIEGKN